MKEIIYLDNNASTKIKEHVWEEMLPYLKDNYANASSLYHRMGREANAAIETSRKQLASALNCQPKEIFFNSGATEAINTVLTGIFKNYQNKGKHIISVKTEHKAVLETLKQLEYAGAEVSYLDVDAQGAINLEALEKSIRADTILLCVMAANNETGMIHPLKEISQICQNKALLFFCDATQYIGKNKLDLADIPIDMVCLSAHKFHGPKGIGALFIRRKSKPIQVTPLIIGGGQEHGFRAGTYPVANIVGLAAAISSFSFEEQEKVRYLRGLLEKSLLQLDAVYIHAHQSNRLSNTSAICFRHILASEIMSNCPTLALSSGSACVSGMRDPSHVLLAMGVSEADAKSTIRFSLSSFSTEKEIQLAVSMITKVVQKLRDQSPIWQLFQAGLIT